jgi:uncharacterized protein
MGDSLPPNHWRCSTFYSLRDERDGRLRASAGLRHTMPRAIRIMTFVAIVLSVWTGMHLYVASRFWNLPVNAGPGWHRLVIIAAVALWCSFPLGQAATRWIGRAALPIELAGASWVGVLFLLLVCLLAADVATGFGWWLPELVRPARLFAIGIALAFGAVALVQGLRSPEVRPYEVAIRNLDPALDGFRIVQLSDLHVGPFLRSNWIDDRVRQVDALHPDVIVVTGDLVDQDATLAEPLVPALRGFRAPLGVYGVTGNHEYYAGLEPSLRVFDLAGIRILRDTAVEIAPGLVIAGVDDLTARRQFGVDDHPLERALTHRPLGTSVLLCHSPMQVDRAAALGVDLMLSGHTHSGQIWPFNFFVAIAYPYVVGRFEVEGMTLIVSRGTGFWGPPMRLFRRSEITLITLKRG